MVILNALAALYPFLLSGQAPEGGGGLVSLLLPLVLIAAVFYFLIMRPQKKREEEHTQMIDSLQKGDQIVTIGGIHGTIRQIDEDSVLAQVDSNGVKLRFDKQAIASKGKDND